MLHCNTCNAGPSELILSPLSLFFIFVYSECSCCLRSRSRSSSDRQSVACNISNLIRDLLSLSLSLLFSPVVRGRKKCLLIRWTNTHFPLHTALDLHISNVLTSLSLSFFRARNLTAFRRPLYSVDSFDIFTQWHFCAFSFVRRSPHVLMSSFHFIQSFCWMPETLLNNSRKLCFESRAHDDRHHCRRRRRHGRSTTTTATLTLTSTAMATTPMSPMTEIVRCVDVDRERLKGQLSCIRWNPKCV